MKCPFCEHELEELVNQQKGSTFVCQQDDHTYETFFDYMDGVTEMLKIGDKIYYGYAASQIRKH